MLHVNMATDISKDPSYVVVTINYFTDEIRCVQFNDEKKALEYSAKERGVRIDSFMAQTYNPTKFIKTVKGSLKSNFRKYRNGEIPERFTTIKKK